MLSIEKWYWRFPLSLIMSYWWKMKLDLFALSHGNFYLNKTTTNKSTIHVFSYKFTAKPISISVKRSLCSFHSCFRRNFSNLCFKVSGFCCLCAKICNNCLKQNNVIFSSYEVERERDTERENNRDRVTEGEKEFRKAHVHPLSAKRWLLACIRIMLTLP